MACFLFKGELLKHTLKSTPKIGGIYRTKQENDRDKIQRPMKCLSLDLIKRLYLKVKNTT